jgi:hypothetical protein
LVESRSLLHIPVYRTVCPVSDILCTYIFCTKVTEGSSLEWSPLHPSWAIIFSSSN